MGCNANPPHCNDDSAVCYDAVAGEECDPNSSDHGYDCLVTCPFECPEPNGYETYSVYKLTHLVGGEILTTFFLECLGTRAATDYYL